MAATEHRRSAALLPSGAANPLSLAARASLMARDARGAAADLEALEATGVHGPAIDARRASIRAGLAALDDRPADALSQYADAIRGFRDLGLPVDEALTAIEMATVLDPNLPEVRVAADAARAILTRLGATPFVDRLDAAMARAPIAAVITKG